MNKFLLQRSSELLTDLTGLSLVGLALNQFARVRETLDRLLPKRSALTVGELVMAYVGLLRTGTSDFDAIENHRQDEFFCRRAGAVRRPDRLDAAPAVGCVGRRVDAARR